MTGDPLFFVAFVIPEPIAVEIRAFQEYASTHFASSAALRSPPHITLVAPFAAAEERRQILIDTLNQIHVFEPLEIVLDGFGAFGKRVIYINVVSDPMLEQLSANIHSSLKMHGFKLRDERRPFHPHVTVAFKDLSENVFEKAWEYFQPIQLSHMFAVDRIHLLEHLQGRWKPIGAFPF